ncbi:MAG: M48 family metallopeptidase [Oscillospiraceae bacterium]
MIDYKIIRSKRKTVALEISKSAEAIVRAPVGFPEKELVRFVESHAAWVEKHIEIRKQQNLSASLLDDLQIEELRRKAQEYLPKRTEYYGQMMGLTPTRITITSAKTRLGSCSGKNAICFSYLVMKYPLEAIDYVVVHELAHIHYHNHGKQFYELISRYLPDYRERIKLL